MLHLSDIDCIITGAPTSTVTKRDLTPKKPMSQPTKNIDDSRLPKTTKTMALPRHVQNAKLHP
jgi:hypothetical protein